MYQGTTGKQRGVSKYGTELTGAEQMQNQFNAEQAQIARDWEEQMYQKYNSPSALMAQYRAAGLNPALMYGQMDGGMDASATSASGSVHSPYGDPIDSLGMVNSTLSQAAQIFSNLKNLDKDLKVKDAEIDSYEAQAELSRANAKKSFSETVGFDIDNQWKEQGYKDAHAAAQSALENDKVSRSLWKADISKKDAETGLVELNKIAQRMSNENYDRLIDLSVEIQQSQILLNKAYTDHERKDIDRLESEIENLGQTRLKLIEETRKTASEANSASTAAKSAVKDLNNYDYYKSLKALDVIAGSLSQSDKDKMPVAYNRIMEIYRELVKQAHSDLTK